MAYSPPRVTIGIPVYNGADTIGATVESVLNQTFRDFEVLVLDNASTDDTGKICEELAKSDPRVRYVRNETTIVQNANFTRVFQLAVGEYFRWMGDDDSLEDEYLEVCVETLDAHTSAAMVTTYQLHVKDDGSFLYDEYTGPRPSSTDPISRLAVMLRLLTGSRLWIDPIYSCLRRSCVENDAPIGLSRYSDQILACELAMAGPFVHIEKCLATRGWKPSPSRRQANREYADTAEGGIRNSIALSSQRLVMLRILMADIRSNPDLDLRQKMRGYRYVVAFGIHKVMSRPWRFAKRRMATLSGSSRA